VVDLTNNNPYDTSPVYKQYRHAQYDKILPVGATGSVSFVAPAVFRYIIVQQQFSTAQAICMMEVEVFKRGTNKTSEKRNRRLLRNISSRHYPLSLVAERIISASLSYEPPRYRNRFYYAMSQIHGLDCVHLWAG